MIFRVRVGYEYLHRPYLEGDCSSTAAFVGIFLAVPSVYFAKAVGMTDEDSFLMLR